MQIINYGAALVSQYAATVQSQGEIEPMTYVATLDTIVDATAGATTTVVGFKLMDLWGSRVLEVRSLALSVFDDAYAATLSPNATFNTATAGTINSGAGSSQVLVTTDASGAFSCTMTNVIDETVYVTCGLSEVSPVLDTKDIAAVIYSA